MSNNNVNDSFITALMSEVETCLNQRHGSLHLKVEDGEFTKQIKVSEATGRDWVNMQCPLDPNIENGNPGLLLSNIVFQALGDHNGQGNLSCRQKAEFRQWIEFISIYGHLLQNNSTSQPILKELNVALTMKSFLTSSCEPNVIDAVFYGLLHKVMANITYQEKEQYVNLSRWFNTVQNDTKIRRNRSVVNFSRCRLY